MAALLLEASYVYPEAGLTLRQSDHRWSVEVRGSSVFWIDGYRRKTLLFEESFLRGTLCGKYRVSRLGFRVAREQLALAPNQGKQARDIEADILAALASFASKMCSENQVRASCEHQWVAKRASRSGMES